MLATVNSGILVCVFGYIFVSLGVNAIVPVPAVSTCTLDGKTYVDGDVFKSDCNSCQCSGGTVECKQKACGNCFKTFFFTFFLDTSNAMVCKHTSPVIAL